MGSLALALLLIANPVELTDAKFREIRAHLRPSPDELSYQGIPWRPTLWGALQEANAQEKPILLWAMNGHPLGCT